MGDKEGTVCRQPSSARCFAGAEDIPGLNGHMQQEAVLSTSLEASLQSGVPETGTPIALEEVGASCNMGQRGPRRRQLTTVLRLAR